MESRTFLMGLEKKIQAHVSLAKDHFGALTEEQLNWKPSENEWSVGQCLEHTRIANEMYLEKLEKSIQGGPSGTGDSFSHGFSGKLMINLVGPKPFIRVPVPAQMEPPANVDRHVLDGWLKMEDRLQRAVRQAQSVDLKRTKVQSPMAKAAKFKLGDCLAFLIAHDERHLLQAEAVLARMRDTVPVG